MLDTTLKKWGILQVFLLTLILINETNGQGIHISVSTNWEDTPLVLEAAEALADIEGDLLWEFVLNYEPGNYTTQKDHFDYFFSVVSSVTKKPYQIELVRYALATRYYNPVVSMHSDYSKQVRESFKSVLDSQECASPHFAIIEWFGPLLDDNFKLVPLERSTNENNQTEDTTTQYVLSNRFKVFCNVDRVKELLDTLSNISILPLPRDGFLFPKEHYRGHKVNEIHLSVYGDFSQSSFGPWKELINSSSADVTTVLRHYISEQGFGSGVSLLGYGAEVVLKSTEYRVVDDSAENPGKKSEQRDQKLPNNIPEGEVLNGLNFQKLIETNPELEQNLLAFRSELLLSEQSDVIPLKRWEMSDLGLQASWAASQLSDPWEFLTDLTGNFPSLAPSLSKVSFPEEYRKNISKINSYFRPGNDYLHLNGRYIDLQKGINPFKIYQEIQKEFQLQYELDVIGIPKDLALTLSRVSLPSESNSKRRIDARSEEVVWVNDLEKDPHYNGWPSTLRDILRPSWPGQLKFVARNLLNIIAVVDPYSEDAFSIYPVWEMFVHGKAPVRLGFLFSNPTKNPHHGEDRKAPASDEPLGHVISSVFYHLSKSQDPRVALSFLAQLSKVGYEEVNLKSIEEVLESLGSSFEEVYSDSTSVDEFISNSKKFLKQRGFIDSVPLFLFNGIVHKGEFSNQGITKIIQMNNVNEYMEIINAYAYSKTLKEKDNVYDFLLDQPTTLNYYHPVILADQRNIDYLSLTSTTGFIFYSNAKRLLPSMEIASEHQRGFGKFLDYQVDYVTEYKVVNPITHILILDLSTQQGIDTLVNLAERFGTTQNSKLTADIHGIRYTVIHNHICNGANLPGSILNNEGNPCDPFFNDIYNVGARSFRAGQLLTVTREIMSTFARNMTHASRDIMKLLEQLDLPSDKVSNFQSLYQNLIWRKQALQVHKNVLNEMFPGKIRPGTNYVVTNGRILELPPKTPGLTSAAFELLEQIEQERLSGVLDILVNRNLSEVVGPKVSNKIAMFGSPEFVHSDLIMKACALIGSYNAEREHSLPFFSRDLNSLNESSAPLIFQAILNPLGTNMRKLAPIFRDLQSRFNESVLQIDVVYNPIPDLSEMPISSYYRMVINSTLRFDEDGSFLPNHATFTKLPTKPIYTIALDAPASWMVHPLIAHHDLDNLVLEDVSEPFVFAEFELKHLVIQGTTLDRTTKEYPHGTEFVLKKPNREVFCDTIVMSNLGYYQLQANPGIWNIQLAPGRSSELYRIVRETGNSPLQPSESHPVFVSSFVEDLELIQIEKLPGKEDLELSSFDVEPEENSKEGKGDLETIHVFSLASGHVYERFLKIMMLSVIKSTKSPVKFWFVENFLSPQFKEYVNVFTKEYGHEVELVSYQWPWWLHAQSEKQRTIWAYKILFLDVLFPLDVHRIIFVDADLIVRSDLKELNELDLEGAPYAYTPFCDSRKEMDGYRFWKQGFWKDHLESLHAKYHISALYVVDLDQFRKLSAGDQLRYYYDSLSQDPNSLANLDQDLPNYTQDQIEIFSLDQSWLWCETWCSDDEKSKAKAIDLCNNPETKAPKLESAVRIVPQWTTLDQEAKELEQKYSGVIHLRDISSAQKLAASTVKEQWTLIPNFLRKLPTELVHDHSEPENLDTFASEIL